MKKVLLILLTLLLLFSFGCTVPETTDQKAKSPQVESVQNSNIIADVPDTASRDCLFKGGRINKECTDSEDVLFELDDNVCCIPKDFGTAELCDASNVEAAYECGDYIKVVSSVPGEGAVYYDINNNKEVTCPVVALESMSQECRELMDCEEKQIC